MLVWHKHIHYGQSLGSLFDMIGKQAEEQTIVRYITQIIWKILEELGDILNIDLLELMPDLIHADEKVKKLIHLISGINSKNEMRDMSFVV